MRRRTSITRPCSGSGRMRGFEYARRRWNGIGPGETEHALRHYARKRGIHVSAGYPAPHRAGSDWPDRSAHETMAPHGGASFHRRARAGRWRAKSPGCDSLPGLRIRAFVLADPSSISRTRHRVVQPPSRDVPLHCDVARRQGWCRSPGGSICRDAPGPPVRTRKRFGSNSRTW
jgi:hypothetical protein